MEKNNTLIAEFMGNPTIFNPIHDATLYQVKEQDNMTYHIDELQYHLSWDWLMPVIDKIQDKFLEHPELEYEFDEIRLSVPDIQQTHYLITEFIKQYNNGI